MILALLACDPLSADAPPLEETDTPSDSPIEEDLDFGGDSEELFDDAVVHAIEVTADPSDWARIQANPENEQYIRVTVEMGDVRVEDVGLRFKGSWGSLYWCADGTLDCDKLNLKLDFHEYRDEQRFYEVKKSTCTPPRSTTPTCGSTWRTGCGEEPRSPPPAPGGPPCG